MKKNTTIAILLAIILLGGILRFYKLGENAFDRDEFFELNSSYGYFKTGQFVSWDFGHGQPFGPYMQDDSSNERAEIFRWQLAQLYRFHEPTEFLTRSVGAAWGVLAILIVYLVTLSMTGNAYVALLAAFLTAVGESEIVYSRRLRMYAMLFPMYLLFSWTVFKFYESKYIGKIKIFQWIHEKLGFNPTYLLPALVAGAVSLDVHMLTVHIVATVGAYAGLLFLVSLAMKKKFSLDKYSITVLIAAAGLLFVRFVDIPALRKLIKKNIFLFQSNYDFFNQYFTDYIYVWIGVALFIFGTWFLAAKMKRGKEAAFLALSAAAPLAMAVFTWKRDVSQRYIYFIQPFAAILSAVAIYGLIYLATYKLRRFKKAVAGAMLIGLLSLLSYGYIYSKSDSVYADRGKSYYPDFGAVFDYVKAHKTPGDVMVTRVYRSFYWKGEDKTYVYDLRSLGEATGNCALDLEDVVKNNPSGWVVFPKVDKISFCSAGRNFLDTKLNQVKDPQIPSSVLVYNWGK